MTTTHPLLCTICNGQGCGDCDGGEITPPPAEAGTHAYQNDGTNRPDPKDLRGKCPECSDDLVSQLLYIEGKGYLMVWSCWASLAENPACAYRRVL